MSISQNFPEEGPTLNLNFAGSKTLDPRITFSRTTTGTYMDANGLIVTAPADAPRFDHRYVNGEIESLGLLVEEERSNLFTRSEEITTAYFGGGGTIGTDTILNPYGISSSVSYVTTSERVRLFNADGYSTLAFSFFSKKRFGGLERDYAYIEIFQVAVGGGSLQAYYFNYDGNNSDGTYVKDVKTEQYPNGWYRFSCRLVARSDYNGGTFSTTSRVDIEGGASDNYVWGIQVEAASFATSYMPTSASQFTRNHDRAYYENVDQTEWFNKTEGTVVFEHTDVPYNSSTPVGYPAVGFARTSDGTSASSIQYYFTKNYGSAQYLVRITPGNDSANIDPPGGTGSAAPASKVGFVYKANDYALVRNGSLVGTDDSGAVPDAYMLIFGMNGVTATEPNWNAHLKNLQYYPTRLSNTVLQTLTK